MDKIAGLRVCHYLDALFCQNRDHQFGVRSIRSSLLARGFCEHSRDPIELGVDLKPDALRPFDLVDRTG